MPLTQQVYQTFSCHTELFWSTCTGSVFGGLDKQSTTLLSFLLKLQVLNLLHMLQLPSKQLRGLVT